MKPMQQVAKAVVAVCLLFAISTLAAGRPGLAQDDIDARGAKGPIGKADLTDALARQARGGPKVAGHVISGPDLIAILGRGDVAIEIRDCVIEGGLDFSDVSHVTAPITIEACEVRAGPATRAPSAGYAVYAKGTVFEEQVLLRSSTLAGPVEFTEALFRKKAIFAGSQFAERASFARVHFSEAAHFSRSHFRSVQFDAAAFKGKAEFRRVTFDATAYFERTSFEKSADFRQAIFRAPQIFNADFLANATFEGAQFEDEVVFSGPRFAWPASGVRFEGEVHFALAQFEKAAVFIGQDFPAAAIFDQAKFGDLAQFTMAQFGKRASFDSVRFQGGALFLRADFDAEARFQSAAFSGEASFVETQFADEVSFVSTQFSASALFNLFEAERFASFPSAAFDAEADFDGAAFGESADFQGTKFKGPLRLTGADLGAYADFRDARIEALDFDSAHNPTILSSRLDLRGARVLDAHLQDVIFEAGVDFSDAYLGLPMAGEDGQAKGPASGTTILRFATFENDVSFARARFAGKLGLENVKFLRTADFTDTDFGGLARDGGPSFAFSYVDFGDLRLRWPQLPHPRHWLQSLEADSPAELIAGTPEPISRVLSELEERFRDAGQLADANAAYFHKKLAKLDEARSSGGWDGTRLLLEAEWLFWGLVCGYGTNLWWAIGWALLINGLFTLIYWSSATVTRHPHPDSEGEFSFRLRLLDLPKQYTAERADLPVQRGPLRKLIDCLRVSSVILFKIGYRDTTLDGRCGPIPIAYLVAVEWALGFYALAAITVTLANTQPLINRLVAGVF